MAVADLNAGYAACLDQRRFAEWPDFFTDDCVYKLRETRWEREQRDAQKLESDRELIRTCDAEIASLEGKVRTLLEQRLK
ncbi:MAG: nuclear transport factor 2 family protein [Betaproteobacteria bacterium]